MSLRIYEETIAKLKELRAYNALKELAEIEVNPIKRGIIQNYI